MFPIPELKVSFYTGWPLTKVFSAKIITDVYLQGRFVHTWGSILKALGTLPDLYLVKRTPTSVYIWLTSGLMSWGTVDITYLLIDETSGTGLEVKVEQEFLGHLYQLSAITELGLDLRFLLRHFLVDDVAKGAGSCLPVGLHKHTHLPCVG